MRYFIFRNSTIEPLFKGEAFTFSGYEDISSWNEDADRYIWFYTTSYKADEQLLGAELRHYENMLELVLSKLDPGKMIFVFTIQRIFKIDYELSDDTVENFFDDYNLKIKELSESYPNLKIIDIRDFYNRFKQEELVDWKYYFLSQMVLNPKLGKAFKFWFERRVDAVELRRKKCVVLDLDNTLWGGILGEDGMSGLKMGEDYPGNAFRFFQQYLLELKRSGIMLTVCSKNNEVDAIEVFDKHPDMLIKKEDLVAYRINWNNKADNIREIAIELNIGLESMVFIDDNPTERELVRQLLPQVIVADFPMQIHQYPAFAKQLSACFFSTYLLTTEDKNKTQQYKENLQRQNFKNQFSDLKSYLKSLCIELTIERIDSFNVTRFAQMTQKTNQFNLTTYRYTEQDICRYAELGDWVYGLRVKDKFGDNGITGMIIFKFEDDIAKIDTFLLSCRVLGKDIEYAFLSYMLLKLREIKICKVRAEYIPTLKNSLVKDFYERNGFQLLRNFDGRKEYELDLKNVKEWKSDIYKIEKR